MGTEDEGSGAEMTKRRGGLEIETGLTREILGKEVAAGSLEVEIQMAWETPYRQAEEESYLEG